MIDKSRVIDMKKAMHADEHKDWYDYFPISAGYSNIASLAYRTSHYGEIGEIPFDEDGEYRAYLITGDTEIPEKYKQVLETSAGWLWIYDDNEKTLDLLNPAGFEIYCADEMDFLIRFK